jgi:hypothetical protein
MQTERLKQQPDRIQIEKQHVFPAAPVAGQASGPGEANVLGRRVRRMYARVAWL